MCSRYGNDVLFCAIAPTTRNAFGGKYLKVPTLPSSVPYAEGSAASDSKTVFRCPNGIGVIGNGLATPLTGHDDRRGRRAYRRGSNLLGGGGAIDTWYACYTAFGTNKYHVAMRQVLFTVDKGPLVAGYQYCKQSAIHDASNHGLIFDGFQFVTDSTTVGGQNLNARHGGNKYTNVLFGDGHCESVLAASVSNNQWTLAELALPQYANGPKWRLDQP